MSENRYNQKNRAYQNSKAKRNRRKYHLILTMAILVTVVLLDLLAVILPDKAKSDTENRNLQQRPELSFSRLLSGKFESEFETYIADQFPFRDQWIFVESTVSRMMGKTESNNIFLGKDGYLIQRFNEPDEKQYQELAGAARALAEVNPEINVRALIAPTAVCVYDEKLPLGAATGDQNVFLNRLQKEFEAVGVEWVDVRRTLRSNSGNKDLQLYYRTDHHWTTDAAYLAFQEYEKACALGDNRSYSKIMVTDSFSGTLTASSGLRVSETDPINIYIPANDPLYVVTYVDENERSASVYNSDNLAIRDKYTLFFNGNHPQVKIESDSPNDKTLLILKDSYANCFVPFLIPYYNKIIMVDPRYYTENIADLINAEGVTDMLFLYNALTLSEDHNLAQLMQ